MNAAGYGGQSPPQDTNWYVYILSGRNSFIYTGCTNNLEGRIKRHNKGEVRSTKSYLPLKLITYIVFTDKYKAYKFEKYLKTGSGRAFMQRHLY